MNRFLKGAVTCSAILFLMAVWFIPAEIATGAFQQNVTPRSKRVDELYNRNCARCHGANGRGDTPLGHLYKAPDFTDPEWWKENAGISNTRTLRSIVTRGKAGMPAFGKKLSSSDINSLVKRVRTFKKTN